MARPEGLDNTREGDVARSLPREGRTIAYDAYEKLTFRVLRMKGNRILEVEVRRVAP